MSIVPTPDDAPTRRLGRLRGLTRRSAGPALPPPGGNSADALFRTVFAQAPIGMMIMNRARVITRANDACGRILGRAAEELAGLSSSDLSLPEERSIGLDLFDEMLTGDLQGYRVEKRLVRPDGTPLWAEITISLIADAPEDSQVIAQIQDVTERKRNEEALVASARELARHAADLERSNAELEQFAYVASHDLSEPLRTVSGFVRLLQERYHGELDDDADTFIDFAVTGTERMQRLIDDLLVYSRAGRADVALEPLGLDEVADLAVTGLSEAIRETRAEVEIEDLPVVLGNRTQLTQLLQNLVANAIKFVPESRAPRVTIAAEAQGDVVVVSVEDNGIGVDPKAAERVFKMFQRLHDRDAYTGTGIGLAIARKIVERHGGRIWHEPVAGGGSRFSFTLPSVPPGTAAHDGPAGSGARTEARAVTSS
jgi:PAS domain S-box-containing protein